MSKKNHQKAIVAEETAPRGPLARIRRFFLRPFARSSSFYFLAFTVPLVMLYLVYVLLRQFDEFKELTVLKIDMSFQYIYYFRALQDWIQGEGSLLYSFSRSLGGEFLGIFTYYLASPISFIVGLFSREAIIDAIMAIYLIKCGLSGLTAAIYLRKSAKVKPLTAIIFATLYAMCGYSVVMHINVMWMDGVLLLPLLMLGIERLITHKKYLLFVATVALNLLCNYYVGYMSCLFAFFYFFYAYFSMTKEERNPQNESRHFLRAFLRIGIFAVIAVAISAIFVLPAYYSLTFGKDSFSTPQWIFETQFPLFDLFVKFMFGSYDTLKYEGIPHMYCGVIVMVLIPLYFIGRTATKRQKICAAAIISLFLFSFSLQFLDLIWHGFQAPNMLLFRYAFMLVFLLLVMAAKVFDRIREFDPRTIISVTLALLTLCLVVFYFDYEHVDPYYTLLTTVLLLVGETLLLVLCTYPKIKTQIVTGFLTGIIMVECYACACAYMAGQCGDFGYNKRSTFEDYMEKWQGEFDYLDKKDTDFYRVERLNYLKYNDSYALGYRGLAGSTSTFNRETLNFLQGIGHTAESHYSYYVGANPVIDSLLGIRYMLDDTPKYIPSVYDHYHTDTEIYAFKNPYALSIAYLSDSDVEKYTLSASTPEDVAELAASVSAAPFGMPFASFALLNDAHTEKKIENVSPFERMNRLVSSIVGEDVKLFYPVKFTVSANENAEIKTNYVEYHRFGVIDSAAGSAEITFTFEGAGTDDIYAYFPSAYANEAQAYVNGSYYSNYFSKGNHSFLYLGQTAVGSQGNVMLRIKNDNNCLWIYKDLDSEESAKPLANCFYALDTELFHKVFTKLADGNYRITSYTEDSFDGTIKTAKENQTVLTTIPYDEGWEIQVDGKPIEYDKTLDALISFRIDSVGEHRVTMVYAPDCITYGFYITAAGLLALGVCLAFSFVRYRKNKKLSPLLPETTEKTKG